MSNPKLTQWFDGSKFVPLHTGVYETDYLSNKHLKIYQFWNGKEWGHACSTIDASLKYGIYKSIQQSPKWRGLAEKP